MNMATSLLGALIVSVSLSGCSQHHAQAASATPHYTAVARGRVAVEGGLLTLTASVGGTLATISVHEGERIRKGQVLATLDSMAAKTELTGAKARLAMAKAKAKLLDLQVSAARQLAQLESAAAKAGAGAEQSANTAHASVIQLKARQDAARAAIVLAQSGVDTAELNLSHHTIRAPVDAYIVRVMTQAGASVSSQSPVFMLLPKRPLVVRAKLNATYVDAVHPGMRAHVASDTNQDGNFIPAHVVRIGRVFGSNNLNDDPGQVASTRAVDCVLTFDKPSDMRVGQRVLVRFLPEKKSHHERLMKPPIAIMQAW